MENILELKDVCKTYKDFQLDNVSFELPKGTIMGFVGANGAGKTTTLKAILNVIHLSGGVVTVFGCDHVKEEQRVKDDLGVVFDESNFSEALSAREVGRILQHIYKKFNKDVFYKYLKKFDLPDNKKIKTFSRGMKMKLSLSAAMSHDAKLLILDEPTSGLDPIARHEVLDMFLEYIEDGEHSILFSSHITVDLEKICDYITFIHKGKILISEEKDLLLDHYGMLKGGKEDFPNVDKSDVLGYSMNHFGFSALIKDREEKKKKYPSMVLDKASIEDIMVFLAEEEEVCVD